MTPITATFRRTVGMARNLYSTALSIGGFLAGVAVLFAFNIEHAEGGNFSLAAIWTISASPLLPALAAFLAMDVWSDERLTGRIDVLLSSPVVEREYVLGKFFGVFFMTMLASGISLIASLFELYYFVPSVVNAAKIVEFLPGIFVLALQGALWSAIAVSMSAFFSHAAASACASLVAMVALPRGLWAALIAWSTGGGAKYGEMPFDAHAISIASGLYDFGVIVSYVIVTLAMLFVATRVIVSLRYLGRNAYSFRFSTAVTVLLTLFLSVILVGLAIRLGPTWDFPINGQRRFSDRTRNILAEARGEISVTAFLSRTDSKAREVEFFFKALKETSASLSGAKLVYRIVDPSWDVAQAERLVRRGAKERDIVFESQRMFITMPIDEGVDERRVASTISRFTKSLHRQTIYWTKGHNEISYSDYGNWGMSAIARDLSHEGFRNLDIDLTGDKPIPADCALIIIAGAKTDFSRSELIKIDQFLKQGGRLLVMMDSEEGGISAILPQWGVLASRGVFKGARTMSGSDVVVDDFSSHVITEPLNGTQIVIDKPIVFERSSAAKFEGAADKLEFSPLAMHGDQTLVVAVERGALLGQDIAIRPTRLVVIGDASFALNAQLATRKNANRDFFLNSIAFLAGSDTSVGSGQEWNQFVTGMDRRSRINFTFLSAVVIPGIVFVLMMLAVAKGRHRQ